MEDTNTLPTIQISEMISDLIPDIIAQVNNDKVYVWFNKAGLDFYGKDAIGKSADYYFEGQQDTYDTLEPLFKGEKDIMYIDSWQKRIDGEKRLLSWTCKSLKDPKGKVVGVLSTAHDITNRHIADEKIKYDEAQLNNAMNLAHLGSWEYDVINDKFTFNDTFYAIFHTTAQQVGGYIMSSKDYAKKFVFPDDIPLVGEEVKKSIETTDPNFTRELEHRILYANGEIGYINVRFFVVKDNLGKTIKTFGINLDITERKHKELEFEKIKKDLEEKISQLESANSLMVNRELKMTDLKKRIETLEAQLNTPKTS